MSNQKVDDIFRNKLENYQVKPHADAWESIQQGLAQKNHQSFPVLKIAAGFLLVALSGIFLFRYLNSNQEKLASQQVAKEEAPVDIPELSQDQTSTIVPLVESIKEEDKVASNVIATTPSKRSTFVDLEPLQPLAHRVELNNVSNIKLEKVYVTIVAPDLPSYQKESLPPVTISFKSGNKMLNDDATSKPAKESTLRKAWDYALSVKNGEERPFNIKEMKNELFASNFKKKSKTQD